MNRFFRSIGVYLIIFVLFIVMLYFYQGSSTIEEYTTTEVSFSEMAERLEAEEITEVNITNNLITGTLKDGNKVYAYAPSVIEVSWLEDTYIFPQMEKGTLEKVNSDKPKTTPWYISMLPTIIMIVVLIFFWMFMLGNAGGGGGKVMQFGKSRARMFKAGELKNQITYDDVAGLDEEKEELAEVVDFLKNPKKYKDLGARIPKGILLVGPPGTGKTYLSKATAGEAGVPFFSISGSDFVEMFVGVGASRVRDLFEQAKKNSPCVVFIDEIDAVGRQRGAGLGGGHDEREQTLNQLLVEMDGFGDNTGIIVLAATNRPDILDPALLRPGRFDRQVVIGTPDIKGREAIFKVHSRNKPLDETVDLKTLARRTPGFTPADIENMLNEAALLTARRNGRKIRMDEIEEAITKVIAGPEKKSRVITEDERRLTAYHEAGHAIVARSLPHSDPVHQITIIPRGRAGGFTMTLPKEEKYYGTKSKMEEMIVHLLGGRVAEKLTLEDISTGASNDIQRATEVARDMVTKYGFSDKLGPVNYSSADEVFLGKDFSTRKNYSEEIASEIDIEIRRIIEDAFVQAETILTEHMDTLHEVAKALLEIETLDGDQFEALYTGTETADSLGKKSQAAAEERRAKNEAEAAETERLRLEEEARLARDSEELEKEAFSGNVKIIQIPGGVLLHELPKDDGKDASEEAPQEEAPREDAPKSGENDQAETGADSAAPAEESAAETSAEENSASENENDGNKTDDEE